MSNIERTRETYREFIDYAKHTPRSDKANREGYHSSSTEGGSFTGTETIEEAYDLAINGWDYGLSEIPLEDGLAVNGGVEFNPSVQGAVVNIGAYLQGLPESMYELTEKREFNLEELTIYVPLMYNAGITVKQSMTFCKNIMGILNKYQATHNVRIIGFFDVDLHESNTRWVNEVVIKDFDSRFVINNIAFSFHTSFFRRIWFKKLETTDMVQWGYGRSFGNKEVLNRIKKESKKYKEKTILVPALQGGTNGGDFKEEDLIKWNF